ncbi:MAG: hypothetical protein JW726_19160 [Anaerolineales bacterium]|nr:hypothetical protein [Anaerolineales bacterium]
MVARKQDANRFSDLLSNPDSQPAPRLAIDLLTHARAALQEWQALLHQPYNPVCLTLYLSNACNLSCPYCYSEPVQQPAKRISLPAVASAARLVAENCRETGTPFNVVFHGGGEPSMEMDLLEQCLDVAEETAIEHGVGIFRYIATNGVMPAIHATWLSQRFDMIGLSCDGPPDIQNSQRPLRSADGSQPAESSSTQVESTAQIIHQHKKPLHVRTTITPDSVKRQQEIVDYICNNLCPQEIHVEAQYATSPGASAFQATQVDEFLTYFMEGRHQARLAGIPYRMSVSRVGLIHGPYCNPLRQVLQLVPGDLASACFRAAMPHQLLADLQNIGAYDLPSERFFIEPTNAALFCSALSSLPIKCSDCFNRFHCTYGCPDYCLLQNKGDADFRCLLAQKLTITLLLERACDLLRRGGAISGGKVDLW